MTLVVDSSALVAVVLGEHDAESFTDRLERAGHVLVSAASLLETRIVVESRQGPDASRDLELLLEHLRVEIVPVEVVQADVAFGAWQRFGKGRHPASLTYGDTFAYALAAVRGVPLLFKGDDFPQTDVTVAT